MKKNLLLTGALFCTVALTSCSSIYVAVTDNPVGSKEGKVSGLKKATIGNAAKNGGITEIGTVKYQWKGPKSVIIVTGN
ncbi:MAG: hypothetical protein RLP15_01820 [Cryomorphaceae bacterium]